MARIVTTDGIFTDDFPAENKLVIEKLGFILNPFFDQVGQTLNGNIDFTNLTVIEKDMIITVDHNGTPTTTTSIRNTLNRRIKGILCFNAISQGISNVYPQGTPFISFTQSENQLIINNISGLVKTSNITSIAVSNPGQITAPNHGLKSGQKVVIFGTSTTPSINNTSYTITVIDGNSFSIPVNITAVATGTGFFRTTDNKYLLNLVAYA